MYGKRYSWWESLKPLEVHRSDAFGSPRALLALEAPQSLMEILRQKTKIILENAETSDMKLPPNCATQDPPACSRGTKFGKWIKNSARDP